MARRRLGRRFGWLWSAYAASTLGTWLAFNAFNLLLIRVLHCGPAEVAALAAVGTAVGALMAVPLGPWIEVRGKRPVMIAMDLTRCAVLLTIPAAYAVGVLGFAQLLVVSVVVGACDIAFGAASGAYLKSIVAREDLMPANGRLESTLWASIIAGPPLGGLAVAVFGPVVTVAADAMSYLVSALGIGAIGGPDAGREPEAGLVSAKRGAEGGVREGWRFILGNATLRPLFWNTVIVNALIMATEPLLAVLMLGRLGFAAWQYGLAFAVPCVGGLAGSRLSGPLVARFGRRRVLMTAGTLRALPPLGLAGIGPGPGGLALVMTVETVLITGAAIFNPVLATYRMEEIDAGCLARALSAWSVSTKAGIAVGTAVWGVLADAVSPRFGVGLAGALLVLTPLMLTPLVLTPSALWPPSTGGRRGGS